jgi:hypothetical protein
MKTAVEWLANEIQEQLKIFFPGATLYQPTIEQAKEMEKEQMKLSRFPIAYENKSWQGLMERHFEQWYNETFKSEE